MCGICGIVSEKFRPESTYWGKMCEYNTKSKAIITNGCFASGKKDSYVVEIDGKKCFAIIDGKIQNINALKYKLNLRGVTIETGNIAELVLLSYIYFGESAFKLFKGQFCAAIWNGLENELVVIRDKVGMNTAFYYFDGVRFVFASEIKGILSFPFVKKELCDDIYCRLFALSGSMNQAETLFLNVYEIPPGCYIRYKNFKTEIVSYHTFALKDYVDNYLQTVSAIEYFYKKSSDIPVLSEKTMTKEVMSEYIKIFVDRNDFPSRYIDLKTLSNLESKEVFADLTWNFNVSERHKVSSVWCKRQEKEFLSGFLSTLPWFEYKDERDISKKEEVYIKQYIVIPQIVRAGKKACKNLMFPFLDEDVAEYSLKSLKYAKKLSKHFDVNCGKNRENYKILKELFSDMLLNKNAMSGLISKEELLKLVRLYPRPETMLYLLQVDIWLNMFL